MDESVNNKEKDLFRDTPVRFLGYANEVGEAFRALVHKNIVRLSYGVAFAYVIADTNDKTKRISDLKKKITTGFDVLIWQTLASVAIPGFTINRLCAISSIILRSSRHLSPSAQKWTTTAIGLASIPLIIKPIDHGADWMMDRSYRKIFKNE